MTDASADLSRPEPGHEGSDELPPGVTAEDAPALNELAAAGWGEGDSGPGAGLPDGYWKDEDPEAVGP